MLVKPAVIDSLKNIFNKFLDYIEYLVDDYSKSAGELELKILYEKYHSYISGMIKTPSLIDESANNILNIIANYVYTGKTPPNPRYRPYEDAIAPLMSYDKSVDNFNSNVADDISSAIKQNIEILKSSLLSNSKSELPDHVDVHINRLIVLTQDDKSILINSLGQSTLYDLLYENIEKYPETPKFSDVYKKINYNKLQ